MSISFTSLDTALSAGQITKGMGQYRSAAARLQVEWEEVAPGLHDIALSDGDLDYVVDLVTDILSIIERHPSITPGHGVGHARRVTAHGISLALSEEMSHADAARLLIATAAHDLGRLVLSEDTSDISHAEVSGVLAEELGEALAVLPAAIWRTAQEAILVHTLAPVGERLWFRVIDDVRTCDGIDNGGVGAGIVRCALNSSSEANLGAALPTEGLDEKTWLGWWRYRSNNPAPPHIARSAWGRSERSVRNAQGRRLIGILPHLDGDPDSVGPIFRALAFAVEPDMSEYSLERAQRRLLELPGREFRRWAGALPLIRQCYINESVRLAEMLEDAIYQGDGLLAPLASRLLADGVARLPNGDRHLTQ